MFVVTEAEAAAIRAAFDRGGEFAAAVGAAPAVPSYHRQSALYRPWIVRACRIRSIPAAVGPGLASAGAFGTCRSALQVDLPMILNKKPYRFLAFLRSMTRSTSRSSKPSAFKALRIRYVLVTPCSAAAIDIARSR